MSSRTKNGKLIFMKATLLFLVPLFLLAVCQAAEAPVGEAHFFDEATLRHLRLKPGDFGSVEIQVRFAADPGSPSLWMGTGQKKDKDVIFARVVGEGEDRGTYFVAEVSESKVEISYKPGQKEPQDAGINGTYRRASEAKRLQLAKKEFAAASDRLVTALKMTTKTLGGREREAMMLWKDQWPALREQWLDISLNPVKAMAAEAKPQSSSTPAEAKGASYWFKLAEATARGYSFVEWLPDPKTGTGWDGEYDDFAGGHVSLRLAKDGRLRMSLTFSRAEDTQTGGVEAAAPADKVVTMKDGRMTAEFLYRGPQEEGKPEPPNMVVRLTKLGRYLQVKTDGAGKYAGRGWFDGIYRGGPVPEG